MEFNYLRSSVERVQTAIGVAVLLELPACFSRRPEHRRIDESDLNMTRTMNKHDQNTVLVTLPK